MKNQELASIVSFIYNFLKNVLYRFFLVSTKCINTQKIWDKKRNDGTVGHLELRPQCDRHGFFYPSMCIPGET